MLPLRNYMRIKLDRVWGEKEKAGLRVGMLSMLITLLPTPFAQHFSPLAVELNLLGHVFNHSYA